MNGEPETDFQKQVEDKSAPAVDKVTKTPADPKPASVKKSASADPETDEPLLERSEEVVNKLLQANESRSNRFCPL